MPKVFVRDCCDFIDFVGDFYRSDNSFPKSTLNFNQNFTDST